jgi:hypothetical protein
MGQENSITELFWHFKSQTEQFFQDSEIASPPKNDRSFGSVFIYRSNARYPLSGFSANDLRVFRSQNMKAIREYIKHKPCLRGQILDRGELKRVAQACGLSPQEARSELKKLGFVLTKNDHGLTVWKMQEDDPLGISSES